MRSAAQEGIAIPPEFRGPWRIWIQFAAQRLLSPIVGERSRPEYTLADGGFMRKPVICLAIILILVVGVPLMSQTTTTKHSSTAKPTVADAEKFMDQAEALL